MAKHLTEAIVKALPKPATGNRITYDDIVKGFGVRVTAAGTRAFVLNYRTKGGRERRLTIGSFQVWSVTAARVEAKGLKLRVDQHEDPLADIEAERKAETVAELCERFIKEHLPRKRASTQRDYKGIINNDILPALKNLKVADVTFADVDGLHRKITKRGAKYRANRVISVLSKMFALAIRWRLRVDNPCKGVERNHEDKRRRYLSGGELARLTAALAEHHDQQAADLIRLLLLTGARRGEARALRWADLDLETGIWSKPGSTTKQKTDHRVPLSGPARQLLADLREKADDDAEFVFPARDGVGHRIELKSDWPELCRAANIKGARLHDLRHTYASILVSAGLSLPVIGALLGHAETQTTARYAHLFDDPLRAATERVGAIVTGKPSADVVPMKRGR